jgi:aminomuconate-semialdehyde/2-hydroxymuconate-6-semialdehyde dehydrogenase
MNNIKNYINGEFVNPINGDYIDNYNPSIGEVYGQIPNSSKEDVEKAYKVAKEAFSSWSNTTLDERGKILSKIAELIKEKLSFLAEAESKDNGKPISLAKQIDIPRAASNFQFFCKCYYAVFIRSA